MTFYYVVFQSRSKANEVGLVKADWSDRRQTPTATIVAEEAYDALGRQLGMEGPDARQQVIAKYRIMRADRVEVETDPLKATGGETRVRGFF